MSTNTKITPITPIICTINNKSNVCLPKYTNNHSNSYIPSIDGRRIYISNPIQTPRDLRIKSKL